MGQRRGLGIAAGRPLYVVNIDAEKNRIVVSDKAQFFSKGLIAGNMNVLAPDLLNGPRPLKVQIRLKHRAVEATVSSPKDNQVKVLFAKPQAAVAPGQAGVLYSDDLVVGGGIIEQAF